jgi:hypothetical protein
MFKLVLIVCLKEFTYYVLAFPIYVGNGVYKFHKKFLLILQIVLHFTVCNMLVYINAHIVFQLHFEILNVGFRI